MTDLFQGYASVILDVAIDKPLSYGILQCQMSIIHPGMRIEVPLRGKPQLGYVLKIYNTPPSSSLKPISRILSEIPLISEELIHLSLWLSKYYCASLRSIFRMLLPPPIRKGMEAKQQLFVMRTKTIDETREACIAASKKSPAQALILEAMLKVQKGIFLTELLEMTKTSRSAIAALEKKGYLTLNQLKIDRSPLIDEEYFLTKPKKLNSEQQQAFDKIKESLIKNAYECHLLYGVTGSGKTEVYLQAMAVALDQGKSAIMLVPEISLTAQTIERFRSRFPGKIAILHHRLSEGERNDEWHQIQSGKAKIIIGARSAIFSPAVNLGLIIVDEEHEHSYKQSEQPPCYQARDVAVMRAKFTNSTVILGSATPSLESYTNALQGKYTLSVLKSRPQDSLLPIVHIVDMKKEFEKAKRSTSFSDKLLSGIEKRLKTGEQTILFLNKRGYHSVLQCPKCTHIFKCTHCDTPMTFHLGENTLACHLCRAHFTPPPKKCPACHNSEALKFKGVGTEQIERALHAIFPSIRTIRLDADTTRHKGSHQKLLREFGSGKADVLIGTQMIAKGLHFPEVTLVGVLNSDSALNIPDFRSSETVFQLITQVAGRSGRGTIAGEVIIQTTMPENSTIQYASKQDFEAFYHDEIASRRLFSYPPFSQMAKFTFTGTNQRGTERAAELARQKLIEHLPSDFLIHPVGPCGYAKIKDCFRFQFLVRGQTLAPLIQLLQTRDVFSHLKNAVRLLIDINPSSVF